jgi:hypothetical protein
MLISRYFIEVVIHGCRLLIKTFKNCIGLCYSRTTNGKNQVLPISSNLCHLS